MSGRTTRRGGARKPSNVFKTLPDLPSDASRQSRGRALSRPDDTGQPGLTRHITPDSDHLPRHTTPDEIHQPDEINPHTAPSDVITSEYKAWVPYVAPKTETETLALHKWNSTGDYIKASDNLEAPDVVETPLSESSFRRATITVPNEFPLTDLAKSSRSSFSRPASSQTDRESFFSPAFIAEIEGSRRDSGSSSLTPDTTAYSSKEVHAANLDPGPKRRASSTSSQWRQTPSALDQLRNLHDELIRLMSADYATEQRHLKDLVTFSNTLGRDEALGEVSKSLRRRAGEKFTMGRAERLILEREADTVYRMTSSEPVSIVEDKVDALQAEREGTRQAVALALEGLFERACVLVDGVMSGNWAGGGGATPSVGPLPPASRTRT